MAHKNKIEVCAFSQVLHNNQVIERVIRKASKDDEKPTMWIVKFFDDEAHYKINEFEMMRMRHLTLNNTIAKSVCACCMKKGVSLTKHQRDYKRCLGKNCRHLMKYESHPNWKQRETQKKKKKENRQFDELFMY
jgi:hypothetical protein